MPAQFSHMARKLTDKEKRKSVIKTARQIWLSLDSHLDWSIEKNPPEKDSRVFHVTTAIEYAEDILRLIKTLK